MRFPRGNFSRAISVGGFDSMVLQRRRVDIYYVVSYGTVVVSDWLAGVV